MSTGTKVAQHYFTYNNIKYFRTKAEDLRLGSYGEKKDPLGAMAYLAVQSHVKNEHLAGHAQFVGPITVDWASQNSADFSSSGEVTYFTVSGSGSAQASYRDAVAANLKLIKLSLTEGALQRILNNEAGGARSFLADEGGDARVVSSVFIVVDATIGEAFAASAGTSGSITAQLTKALGLSFKVTTTGSSSRLVTVEPGVGSTFAYGLHKVSDWNRGRTRVEDLEDDRKGMG